jgi:hypothetical protein
MNMSVRLALARIFLPLPVRKRKLGDLFLLTARAFNATLPPLEGLSWADLRLRYGEFSGELAEKVIRNPEEFELVKRRLLDGAFRLGQELRHELRISSAKDAMTAARILYKTLKMDFRGNGLGDIVIRKCFFSRLYSPEVCRLMSSVDAGILAGLIGGGTLDFTQRLTEGYGCCRAHFLFKGKA